MIVTSREVNIEVARGSFQRAIVVRMLTKVVNFREYTYRYTEVQRV